MFSLYQLSFVEKKHEGSDIYTFYFERPEHMTWRPGQHFVVSNGVLFDSRGPVRIFSASSAPSERLFSFTTRYFGEKSSAFKRKLFQIKKGEKIRVFGPSPIQDFFVVDDFKREYLFLVGGIGVTPLASVVREVLQSGEEISGRVLYGATDDSPAFFGDLRRAQESMSAFSVDLVVEPKRIDSSMIEEVLRKMHKPKVIISGPPGFVVAMNETILAAGIPPKDIAGYKLKPAIGGGYA